MGGGGGAKVKKKAKTGREGVVVSSNRKEVTPRDKRGRKVTKTRPTHTTPAETVNGDWRSFLTGAKQRKKIVNEPVWQKQAGKGRSGEQPTSTT